MACSEPAGRETVAGDRQLTAHDLAIEEIGHCPWCGEESE